MRWFKRILLIGVQPKMSFREKRKVTVINLAGFLGGTSSILFLLNNIYSGLYTLAIINVITLLGGYSILYFNHRKIYKYPPIIIGSIYSVSCSASALLYDNNMEFYLLIFIGVYFTLLEDMKSIISLSLLNAALFLFIQLNPHYLHVLPPVSGLHRFVVLFNGIVLFLFFLYLFKRQTSGYQNKIERQNKELNLLNLNKEKLFAIIAHDIRGPIASVSTALEMANDNMFSEGEFAEISSRLSEQVKHVRQNIDNLLTWSQSQLNGIKVEPRLITIVPTLEKVNNAVHLLSTAKSLTIDMTGIADLTVFVDPDHLELIFRNLISNAIKFSHAGGCIRVFSVKDGDHVQITVQDEGTGISEENAARIFKDTTFHSSYGTSNEKGTGLGLKLCKEFVEKNGGKIWLKSVEGVGSSFTFSLPA